jgi:hypothetical protein
VQRLICEVHLTQKTNFKDHELVWTHTFHMNRPQTYNGSSFEHPTRDILICNGSVPTYIHQ